jgi:uncharacterized membrane protein YcgQ (UPF0703/DUF1980 family)
MKQRFLAGCGLVIIAGLVLAGCNAKRLPAAKNKNGTQAVALPGYPGGDAVLSGFSSNIVASNGVASNVAFSESSAPLVDQASRLVEIKEKMFLAQTNDVYLNPEDYLGKTFKMEGIFQIQRYLDNDNPYYFVIRYGPGCCGNDGNAGFEVAWEGDGVYPQENDWVEAVGVLASYEEEGYPYLCINLSSLQVLPQRGVEFVTQ